MMSVVFHFFFQAEDGIRDIGVTGVQTCALPISMFCPMWVGATSVFYPERPTPQTVFETLRGYQPTMFYAVPTLYAAILADADCTPERGSSRLRLCFSAGEPLPAHVGESWKARFGL